MSELQDLINQAAKQMSEQQTQSTTSADLTSVLQQLNNNVQMNSKLLKDLTTNNSFGKFASQANAQDRVRDSGYFKNNYDSLFGNGRDRFSRRGSGGSPSDRFEKEFNKVLTEAIVGSDYRKRVERSLQQFADKLGVSVKDLPEAYGKLFGERFLASIKKSKFGSKLFDKTSATINKLLDKGLNMLDPDALLGGAGGDLGQAVTGAISPQIAAILGPVALVLGDAISGLFKGLDKVSKTMTKVAFRAWNSDIEFRKKSIERFKADIETMIKTPFDILEEAAKNIYSSWDSNLRVINATQGYDKAGLQDLMSAFAQRLRQEGLSSYISGTDLINNLTKVLEGGLSGKIAEEFAYQATKLGAAIPTQDFFSYVSSYASVASNAVRAGKSQAEAIEVANASLESFASSLLYASRELSGGFTTGLTHASSLYEQAVKIAQAGRTTNIAEISSVLLAVSSELGAVAPDLASSITDAIYKMLVGGNSSDVVALRSLAGINASNTEFLRAVAQDPKGVFSTLFNNLYRMFNDSSDAYMEKAEGYAELFGLSAEAFQRINFADLGNAINRMTVSDSSLAENMKLLKDGQTTTSTEQLKMQQINQLMIEEGLAYVLDNEAARAIQQHMWDEELARQQIEAQYMVDLEGTSLDLLESIYNSVSSGFLGQIFGPVLAIGKGILDFFGSDTNPEKTRMDNDIKQMLELVKVGTGSAESLYHLTTRGVEHNIVDPLVNMLGGVSTYFRPTNLGNILGTNELLNPSASGLPNYYYDSWDSSENILGTGGLANPKSKLSAPAGVWGDVFSILQSTGGDVSKILQARNVSSRYIWGSVGKSVASDLSDVITRYGRTVMPSPQAVQTASGQVVASASADVVKSAMEQMLSDEYVQSFIKEGKTFEDWLASSSKFNIADINTVLSDAGVSQQDMQAYFLDQAALVRYAEAEEVKAQEKVFRETGIAFWQEEFPTNFKDPLFVLFESNNAYLVDLIARQDEMNSMFKRDWLEKGWSAFVTGAGENGDGLLNKFYKRFVDYFINHVQYSSTTGYTYKDVEAIQQSVREQERGDTVYALAEMLTKNLLDLSDPTMQTNALLAQILVLVSAIKAQGDGVDVPVPSLPDQLFSLSTFTGTSSTTGNDLASPTNTRRGTM